MTLFSHGKCIIAEKVYPLLKNSHENLKMCRKKLLYMNAVSAKMSLKEYA